MGISQCGLEMDCIIKELFIKAHSLLRIYLILTFLILADYAYNLKLYKNKKNCFKTELLIAKCSGKGISKSGSWKLYKEEYSLKIQESSPLFGIFHYLISVLKYFLRKRINAKK